MAQRELPRAVKMAAEIAKIKRSLNVEKKHKDTSVTPVTIGQVNHNSDGAHVIDITPTIAQGTDGDERNGNSCKLTGFALKYQMIAQDGCRTKRRIRFMLVKSASAATQGISHTSVFNAMFDVNPLTTVRDLQAPRNYSSMKHHGLSVLRTGTCYIGAQGFTDQSGTHDNSHKTGTFTAALQDVLRFDGSADNTPEHVKYYLIIQADVGNIHATSDSTLSVPVTGATTGVDMKSTLRTWWVDN
tara:strand:- start:1758 stop:2486 length:729 start_codon:yes stop_codon:yes gene_type:complete